MATLCTILPAGDLNLRPPAPEMNALPLDQLAKQLKSCHQQGKSCTLTSIILMLCPHVHSGLWVVSMSTARCSSTQCLEYSQAYQSIIMIHIRISYWNSDCSACTMMISYFYPFRNRPPKLGRTSDLFWSTYLWFGILNTYFRTKTWLCC